MKFKETLQKQYSKHLNVPLLTEKLDQKEMERLLNIANEIREVMAGTPYKVDVLQFLFDLVMEETDKCRKCAGVEDEETQYQEDEFTITPAQRDAVNIAYTLSQGKAKGGLASTLTGGLVGDPVKKMQKAYGTLLSKVAGELEKTAQGIGKSTP